MNKTLLILATLSIIITACAAPTEPPASPSTSPTMPPVPTSIPPQNGDLVPSPADSTLSRGEAHLDSVELLTMESFPLQFTLALKGGMPNPCHHLRVAVSPPDVQNKIDVDVYTVVDPTAICAQVIQEFDVNFQLGSYPTGHYTLFVNGQKVAEFDA
jgi:hypothetical protein